MEKGTLIEFRLHGERRLAVTERPEGKKDWIAVDENGQYHKIRPQRIECQIDGGPYKASDIPSFLQEVQPLLDPSSLEVAWELLVEDYVAVAATDMAQLLFSDTSPPLCYAAHLLLSEDKIYFKKKGNLYEPRSSTQVQEIQHQIQVEEQKNQEKEGFFKRLEQALAKEEIAWESSDRTRLESLEKYVLTPENNSRQAQEILETIQRTSTAEGAFELLVDIGWWKKHENLFLRRSSYPINFSKKVLEVAESIRLSPPPDRNERLDLTHLKTYTIDDESTREIDDGLSIEYLDNNKVKIWIHIADPTRLVTPGDELDLEARRRSTTLYLPTGMISMFPHELATGPMSLVQGQICPALSFSVILDDTGAVEEYSIHATSIKPTYRLTYHDVDEMLHLKIEAESEIAELAKWAKLRSQWRRSGGSIEIHMPESSIKVNEEDEVTIELLDNSVSRQLVAEMMILAGEIAGSYARDRNLPVPYRSQPQPELPPEQELLQLPAGPVRFCALRRCMPRSEMGTTPSRHAGLGLNIYTQVTSPIRRYTDLLTHFQLKAHLRGEEPPFNIQQLQEIIYSVSASAYEATLVERQTNRYWSLEFLRRNSNCVWQGLVLRWLREDEKLGIILLEELGLELAHRFDRDVTLGDRLEFMVTRADPHRDEIRFREVISRPTESATS
ncbi:MAG: ribonuclease catalytic domain-containing protein [Prochloraceae cyanobacterium]